MRVSGCIGVEVDAYRCGGVEVKAHGAECMEVRRACGISVEA